MTVFFLCVCVLSRDVLYIIIFDLLDAPPWLFYGVYPLLLLWAHLEHSESQQRSRIPFTEAHLQCGGHLLMCVHIIFFLNSGYISI